MKLYSTLFNTMGLTFDIIGVVLLFFFASIQPNHSDDGSFGFKDESPDAAEKENERQKRKRKYYFRSKTALAVILLGFILQLLSVWL